MPELLELRLLAGPVLLFAAAVIAAIIRWRPPGPPPARAQVSDLEQRRQVEAVRRWEASLGPVREVAEDPTAERRTEAIARGIDR